MWREAKSISSEKYLCGYCSSKVASDRGFVSLVQRRRSTGSASTYDSVVASVYICPHCDKPSFFQGDSQVPGVVPGNDVDSVPEEVARLYNEARRCVSVNAFTGSVLISRKILMNLAVKQGADEGKSFAYYVDYLADSGYVPPGGKSWVDHIRKKGNDATHEVVEMTREDASELISFVEMLLKFIYEFPSRISP